MTHIEFDKRKDQDNFAKHGLPLSHARLLEWDDALVWVDGRYGYPELRMIALVPAGSRLFYVSFVEQAEIRRIISLRYAAKREIKHYVENYP
jgi:uncharacterized protein